MWKQGCSRLPRTSLKHKKGAILKVLRPWQASIIIKKFGLIFFEILIVIPLIISSEKVAKILHNSLFKTSDPVGWPTYLASSRRFYFFEVDSRWFKNLFNAVFFHFELLSRTQIFRLASEIRSTRFFVHCTNLRGFFLNFLLLENMSFALIERVQYGMANNFSSFAIS